MLNKLFYKPMKEQQILPDDYLQLLFPNLEQILTIHLQFNSLMEAKKKENPVVGDVGDILLKTVNLNICLGFEDYRTQEFVSLQYGSLDQFAS